MINHFAFYVEVKLECTYVSLPVISSVFVFVVAVILLCLFIDLMMIIIWTISKATSLFILTHTSNCLLDSSTTSHVYLKSSMLNASLRIYTIAHREIAPSADFLFRL